MLTFSELVQLTSFALRYLRFPSCGHVRLRSTLLSANLTCVPNVAVCSRSDQTPPSIDRRADRLHWLLSRCRGRCVSTDDHLRDASLLETLCHCNTTNTICLMTSANILHYVTSDTTLRRRTVWRTRGDYSTARVVLEAIIAFSAMHTYYEQLIQVKQICLCLTGFTSLCLDAYVFLCSLVLHCMHVVLL